MKPRNRAARAAIAGVLVLGACASPASVDVAPSSPVAQEASPNVPPDWIQARSTASGFSFFHPPDWRTEAGGMCDDRPYKPDWSECRLIPAESKYIKDEVAWEFYLAVALERYGSARDAEEYVNFGTDNPGREYERHQEQIGGRTWYVLTTRADPEPPPGWVGMWCECVLRRYVTDHRSRVVLKFLAWSLTPQDFARFSETADRIVRSTRFHQPP